MRPETLVASLGVIAAVAPFVSNGREIPDPRTRTYVEPQNLVWHSGSNGSSVVKSPEILLTPRFGQVPEGKWIVGSGCVLENKSGAAGILLDFGRELHGGLVICSGGMSKRNMKIRVRFGESVAEAMADNAGNDHAIRDCEIELPWFGTRELGNTGFRYARLDLVTPGSVTLEFVRAVSLMRPMRYLGGFRSSDDRLNRIWETAARTVHLCCQDYLWDGIKRDRLVWMGDMHPEMMSVLAVFGRQPILPESMDFMRETSQQSDWPYSMNNKMPYTLWWVRCVHDWYCWTGDAGYVRPHQEYLRGLFKTMVRNITPENRFKCNGFLDWPTQKNPKAVDSGMQALAVKAFDCGAVLAAVLGDDDMKSVCEAGSARIRQNKVDPEGSKQAAALLALTGLRTPREMADQVLCRNGVAGVSTFYGYYMLEALSAAGENQAALDTVRDYWGAMLDMGATSFWEDFNVEWTNNVSRIDEMPVPGQKNIHRDFGDYCYVGFRHSLCHGWSSGPAAWLIHHVLGIQPVGIGCKTVRVRPFLGGLDWAEGSLPIPQGVVRVRHERQADGSVKTDVTAPQGVTILKETERAE